MFAFLMSLTLMASAQSKTVVQNTEGNKPPNMMEERVEAPKGAVKVSRVFFIEPKEGATLPTKFKVKMGVEGMKIRPAGEAPDEVTTGHHHLLIDTSAIEAGRPIPENETHLHFGKGQTEVEVTLKPGKHTLTLQFADGAHRSYGPLMSKTITVHVK